MPTTYLRKFLALVVRQQRPQRLETGVNTLHPTSFIAVGDFSPHTLLLLHVASRCHTADVAGTISVAQRFDQQHGEILRRCSSIAVAVALANQRPRRSSRSWPPSPPPLFRCFCKNINYIIYVEIDVRNTGIKGNDRLAGKSVILCELL